jgi:hypothetical protein
MKRAFIIIFVLIFAFSVNLMAVDKVQKNNDTSKQTSKKTSDRAKYQNFIDSNNNGIDDNFEKGQKETTKVEPKRETEKPKPPVVTPTEETQKKTGEKAPPKDETKSEKSTEKAKQEPISK